ncbi:carboxypeptidase-like regulatory domain-containing protein [Stieleria varia]|uniref:Nickel uptake substrate-specific transmembrane region n=1 Tax=Stieleria varia TaxID=2528005 RepID=A0A5C6AQ72_9BACT|nr:carboxypeptidase-like regulatory domain-containing protein [Stieleria varia]TWU02193.1 Nickel uptake substrate-specific transmembrane region [Stieleria varia]
MTKEKAVFTSVALATALTTFVGCGPGGPSLGQVTGVVLSDGKPVPNVSIELIPIEGRPSLARTDAEGKFTAYYLPGQPGAATGTHRLKHEFVQAGPGDVSFERPKRRNGKKPEALVLEPKEIQVVAGESIELELKLVESK